MNDRQTVKMAMQYREELLEFFTERAPLDARAALIAIAEIAEMMALTADLDGLGPGRDLFDKVLIKTRQNFDDEGAGN